jgi:hypothetical protein
VHVLPERLPEIKGIISGKNPEGQTAANKVCMACHGTTAKML